MTLSEIEKIAAQRSVSIPEAKAACESSGRSLKALLDEISLGIACRYIDGNASFDYCDAVMNGLFDIILLGEENAISSDLAWGIYLAFDEGEYRHLSDAPDIKPREKYTRPMLLEILEGKKGSGQKEGKKGSG